VKGIDEYQKLMNNPDAAKHKKADWQRFAEYYSYGKSDLFTSGDVYIGWTAMEHYLNEIIQKLIPDSAKKYNIYVYLANDADYNAFAIHDGSLFVNVGLFADMNSESALAISMAHELSHFLLRHAEKEYFQSLKSKRKKNREKIEMQFDQASHSRENENAADSLGYILAANAGYDLKYQLADWNQVINMEKGYDLGKVKRMTNVHRGDNGSGDDQTENRLSSHPVTSERYNKLKATMPALNHKDSKEFVVSNDTFQLLQSYARYESLNILLEKNMLNECVEKSYVYYLQNPSDNLYLYFLVESVRREIYLDKQSGKKPFMQNNYPSFITAKNNVHKCLRMIVRDSTVYDNIKATELADPNLCAFTTYDEALKYFIKIGEGKKNTEIFLSDALYQRSLDNTSKSDSLIKVYTSNKSGAYPAFADALMKNDLIDTLATKELVLVDKVDFWEDHFYGLHERFLMSDDKFHCYRDCMNTYTARKFPQKTVVYIPDIETTDINMVLEYRKTIISSMNCYISQQKQKKNDYNYYNFDEEKQNVKKSVVDLFVLNPAFWSFFRENRLKSIEYISTKSYNDKTRIVKLLNLINPFYYLGAFKRFFTALYMGSRQHQYEMEYFSFQPISKDLSGYYSSKIVTYKITPLNFMNTVYYNFKDCDRYRKKGKRRNWE